MSKEIQHRGVITKRIQKKSKTLLGYKIESKEFELMGYMQYIMMNDQHLEPTKLSVTDIPIVKRWTDKKYISFTDNNKYVQITKEFWDIINELLYLGYVDIVHEEEETEE